jgi:hypothetical protein
MFFRADGFVCTGTLINPRTVLFAAHCVNDVPATDFNADNIPAAFSFNVNALPGFQNWIANNFASNPSLAVFNISRIFYDPRSLQNPQAASFIEADIALASLDTPAAGIPTWALLFTTLPAPNRIDPVTGTGYHVNIVGYGATGNAAQGAVGGIDFRRRAAENMLGGFISLNDRNAVLFGSGTGLPQNLYHLDFDSQNRVPVFDINVHRDNALPNEGITAGGDSGGPLILDAANNTLSDEDLVIGVLSGGSRFFGSQRFSSLGTTSFYQPLSLYWQYIAATNPYRYVGARAGNGNWEDPSRWVTLLDPAYRAQSGPQWHRRRFRIGLRRVRAAERCLRQSCEHTPAGQHRHASGPDARQRPAGRDRVCAKQHRSGDRCYPCGQCRSALLRRHPEPDRHHHALERCHHRPADRAR